jgi:hypothetical protein
MTTKTLSKPIRDDTAQQYKRIRKILKDGLYKREKIAKKTERDEVIERGQF